MKRKAVTFAQDRRPTVRLPGIHEIAASGVRPVQRRADSLFGRPVPGFGPLQVLPDLYPWIERAGVSAERMLVERIFEFLDLG